MTPKEKLQMIEDKIKLLNDNVLKYKKWKIAYANKGSNNYCLTIVLNNEELFCGKFDTYGSVLSCLELMEFMFSKALEERQKESVKNKKNKKEEK
jgi:hypothetical protein